MDGNAAEEGERLEDQSSGGDYSSQRISGKAGGGVQVPFLGENGSRRVASRRANKAVAVSMILDSQLNNQDRVVFVGGYVHPS